eukprot:820769_1
MKASELSFTAFEPRNAPSPSSSDVESKSVCSPSPTKHVPNQTEIRLRMRLRGYRVSSTKLANTLQGSVWRGINLNFDRDGRFNPHIVIKVASKSLSISGSTLVDGKCIAVEESIVSEMRVLRYLTQHGAIYGLNKYLANYIDFFHDDLHYYLVMENGGSSLFDFIFKAHQSIASRKLSILKWHNVCKILFKKMITFVDIIHSMNVCHLDISLENILIFDTSLNDLDVMRCSVRFCDFGLSQVFDAKANPRFLCNKYVGKTLYKSPEVYEKKANYNAKAADVWSLGVCLFAMLTGAMPFTKASPSDPSFEWVMSGHVLQLIKHWKKVSLIDTHSLDVLFRIFKKESQRIGIKQLLSHSWLQYIYNKCFIDFFFFFGFGISNYNNYY